ncbi:DUF441 domain-containing protein [Sporosalibacterium faouarense]|uniref:DUF441 domain-containing protein n=1 Tax=Sporosalibacterium faouarense TaxID=516123 RepID=UPI00192C8843|nr:DUF441 domain-containing protein [Sporosalibacterium faouarense]
MSQPLISNIIILILLALAIISRNNYLAIATSFLLLVSFIGQLGNDFQGFSRVCLEKLDDYGLKIGIIFLMMGILSPLALGKVDIKDLYNSIKTVEGVTAIIAGIIVSVLASKGGYLLEDDPIIMFSIIFGTIIGIVIFKGYPIGPLVGSGITVIIINVINALK